MLLTMRRHTVGLTGHGARVVCLDEEQAHISAESAENPAPVADAANLARQMHGLFRSFKDNIGALMRYEPRKYPGRINLFRASQRLTETPSDPTEGWRALAAGGVELHVTPGDHYTMINMPHARVLAERLGACIEATLGAAGATEKGVFS